ncbi:uncharacterized protein V1510DRAFT_410064 [Dipodascopsis tothii]|uniref:uncharacterized protein n=1 Tax=Dipodascopsis tothii TaxID=44089 RepID=UPI0034CFE446
MENYNYMLNQYMAQGGQRQPTGTTPLSQFFPNTPFLTGTPTLGSNDGASSTAAAVPLPASAGLPTLPLFASDMGSAGLLRAPAAAPVVLQSNAPAREGATFLDPLSILTSPQPSNYSEEDVDGDNDEDDMERRLRKNFLNSLGSGSSGSSKKQLQDMDDDERLLASEEGKKLSSKERRQLRNKVSARHFRLRRKEYITHLEALVAAKSNESSSLKSENDVLKEENKKLTQALQNLLVQQQLYVSPSPPGSVYENEYEAALPGAVPALMAPAGQSPFQQYLQSPPQSDASGSPMGAAQADGQAKHQQKITPRIVNLLPTFNSRKDTNPNAVDWPLAYNAIDTSAPNTSSSSNGNMQVFNTLVPENLAELEKAAFVAEEAAADDSDKKLTLEVITSKPDKETKGKAKDEEGIWDDAIKAAEEVYKRLGVRMAGLKLD